MNQMLFSIIPHIFAKGSWEYDIPQVNQSNHKVYLFIYLFNLERVSPGLPSSPPDERYTRQVAASRLG